MVIFVTGVALAIPPPNGGNDECQHAMEREQCFEIYMDAVETPRSSSMKESFQHYCRTIPDFVPCLERNEVDYEAMSQCPEDEMFISEVVSRFDHLMTWREMFNITLDFIDTVNNIVCTRTDEIIKLLYCIKKNQKEFKPLGRECGEEHMEELRTKLEHNTEDVDAEEICSSTYGYATCMKDGLIDMCGTEYIDLLDTAYYDVVEDVIGDGFGCPESSAIEPLLDFARSVRNLYKK